MSSLALSAARHAAPTADKVIREKAPPHYRRRMVSRMRSGHSANPSLADVAEALLCPSMAADAEALHFLYLADDAEALHCPNMAADVEAPHCPGKRTLLALANERASGRALPLLALASERAS